MVSLATRADAVFAPILIAASLLLGVVLAAASALSGPSSETAHACCTCLAGAVNELDAPCADISTEQCDELIHGGQALPSSSYCLRDACAADCSELAGELIPRAQIAACCACLAAGTDPLGPPCLDIETEACLVQLDNGGAISSTPDCFDQVCATDCAFLSHGQPAPATDAGPVDGG